MNLGDDRVDLDVRVGYDVISEGNGSLVIENHHMGRPAKVEHPQLITDFDVLLIYDLLRQLAGRHFAHSKADKAHQVNKRIVSLDENDSASGSERKEWLRADEATAWITRYEVRVTDLGTCVGYNGIVGALENISIDDLAIYGSVPAMEVLGTEECLVDGSTDELVRTLDATGARIAIEHVVEGIWLPFKPELIVFLHPG